MLLDLLLLWELCGEAGEFAEKIKKLSRNRNILVPFYDIATTNIDKLLDRRERGVIKSVGDNR